ncbi:uncharacterized protein LOC128215805 [Mya arenaria]|uniref:uncharacterized protein LOC128215805 n=1 Tax=Mya arenaria TaxID=6604 RepID=UPI0022E49508|nr:uncharacterized protein LOC128215805 [Mya arenaria]
MASGGSSFHKGSDMIHDYSCFKCEENDLNTEAQHFCPQCEHYLCQKCVNIHGDYFKKHVVYGRGDIQKWAGFSMDRCAHHGKELEVHCDDHQELCCSVCVALNHRLCTRISHLPDLARGFLQTAEFIQLPAAVYKMRDRLDELKNDRIKDQASLKDSFKDISSEIKAFRKKINQILDKLEKKTIEQLDNMMEDFEKSIKDDLETFALMHDQLSTMIEKLQQSAGKNKESSCYIGFIKCKSKLSEAKSIVQEIREKERMKFKSDEIVLPFLRKLNSLGNVKHVRKTDSIHVYKAQSSSQYKVKIKKDKSICDIVGICELPTGEVVIADYNNKRVKLLNRQYEVIDHCDLQDPPEQLCHITGSEVAVAVNGISVTSYGVHFFTVTKGKLLAVRKFTTDHEIHAIAHHQGKLYMGSHFDLHLYTMDGNIIKTICDEKSPYHIVHRCAVSPDGERIYVINPNTSKLITLDTSGHVLSTEDDSYLERPYGLCVSPSGHMFVCGQRSNTVVQVDKEGRKTLATVARMAHGLWNPRSVWFSEQTSTLIVGNFEDDSITVVQLC